MNVCECCAFVSYRIQQGEEGVGGHKVKRLLLLPPRLTANSCSVNGYGIIPTKFLWLESVALVSVFQRTRAHYTKKKKLNEKLVY